MHETVIDRVKIITTVMLLWQIFSPVAPVIPVSPVVPVLPVSPVAPVKPGSPKFIITNISTEKLGCIHQQHACTPEGSKNLEINMLLSHLFKQSCIPKPT